MLSVKRQIEKKKELLSQRVRCGQIVRSRANDLLKEFAQFASRLNSYYGSGANMFNNIPATKMLILVIATFAAIS